MEHFLDNGNAKEFTHSLLRGNDGTGEREYERSIQDRSRSALRLARRQGRHRDADPQPRRPNESAVDRDALGAASRARAAGGRFGGWRGRSRRGRKTFLRRARLAGNALASRQGLAEGAFRAVQQGDALARSPASAG